MIELFLDMYMQYFDESWFHGIFAKKSWKQNSEFPQTTVWKNEKFTATQIFFRQIDFISKVL